MQSCFNALLSSHQVQRSTISAFDGNKYVGQGAPEK